MIFVTVGTHEQPMTGLFEEIEKLIENQKIQEEVIVQSGYGDYPFRYCKHQSMIPFGELQSRIKESRLVITHGGPATIAQIRMAGKLPVVVPRTYERGEHVNNHQVDFCRLLEKKQMILPVYCLEKLGDTLERYSTDESQNTLVSEEPPESLLALCKKLTAYCESL